MRKIVLATANNGKIREFNDLFLDCDLQIIAQDVLNVPAVEETGASFIENAILKARHAAKITGLPAIADDSGLAVDILSGAPGIYSARYAGKECDDVKNCTKLLAALQHVPQSQRTAHFHCVLAYLRHADDPMPIVCQGTWTGEIALQPIGKSGFGYDPIFYLPTLNRTAAELTPAQKNSYSHRSQALRQLLSIFKHD